jgi:hypothetical protein
VTLSSPYSKNSVARAKNRGVRWLLVSGVLLLVSVCHVFAREATLVGTITDPTAAGATQRIRHQNGHWTLQCPGLVLFARVMR